MNSLDTYDKVRSQMKSMDCIAYRGDGIIQSLIQIWSPGCNHVGLVLDMPLYRGKENRRWTLSAEASGINLDLLSTEIRTYYGEVWWYPLKDEFDPLREKATEWALSVVGTAYDYQGLFENIFGHTSMEAKKFFCSKYACRAWMEAGIIEKTKIAPRPNEIIKLPIFKEPVLLVGKDN